MSDKENEFGTILIRGIGLIIIIGVIWGWDSFDKVLDIFGFDASKNRQSELLLKLSDIQNYQNPITIVDLKSFKKKITSFTDIQEENYEEQMKNSIWEVTGELYDVENQDMYADLNKYEIDLILNDDSFTRPRTYAYCYARNSEEKNLIEQMSAKTMVTLRGKFSSVSSLFGGYLYLDDCVITKIGNKKLSNAYKPIKKAGENKILKSTNEITNNKRQNDGNQTSVSSLMDNQICNRASIAGEWNNSKPEFVKEAKRRGLNCGVSVTSNNETNVSDLELNKKKSSQVKILDEKIQDIISKVSEMDEMSIKLSLKNIKWKPIGNDKIDNEMQVYYNEVINDLLQQFN